MKPPQRQPDAPRDVDPQETQEWLDSLEDLLYRWGPERVRFLVAQLRDRARLRGVELPYQVHAPHVNTIPPQRQPDYPGDVTIEERIENWCRWNAMAMVVRANREHDGLGGHLATYASVATVYEVGFHHLFHARDQVFIQGHGSPGIYARSYLEGRLSEEQLLGFRQELAGGLPSYPHPWLMPWYWQFPTVSMGLGPLFAIYQARFNRYLEHRGLTVTKGKRVWAFLGDGEMDEPESLGAIDIAVREKLDNLTFVVNCNLQRLDGPVRGNGSIVRELEGTFRGAGWNVIKVLWGSEWDELFAKDEEGHLARILGGLVDGELQRFSAAGGAELKARLFDKHPELAPLVEGWDEARFAALRWGGHDRLKVYAAMKSAVEHQGVPTAILVQTVKGYGMGPAHGKNVAHQLKKLKHEELLDFRVRFQLDDVDDDELAQLAFEHPGPDAPEVRYLKERREALGGPLPARTEEAPRLETPALELFAEFMGGSAGRPASTTMAFVRMLNALLRDKALGKLVVPIIPDEARTFGMEAFFRSYGIYSPVGQLYEPVDKGTVLFYHEAKDGQVLEEGITEAGAMCSFMAAGTAYSTHGVNTIPFYVFYSMFGFQRIGDLVWMAGDLRCRGFLLGATFGRTTLNGEGLQHEDGHSLILASTHPHVRAYEPAYAYEIAALLQDGLRRMYHDQEPCIYYITLHNENQEMPALPEGDGVVQAIVDGMYLLRRGGEGARRVQLFGSGALLEQALRAADLLAERYEVVADVWSVTSYKQLRQDALVAERWNRLHPDQPPRACPLTRTLEGVSGPFVAVSDSMKLVPDQIAPWVPGRYVTLGTDGFGRSDTRERLRRHFEVDAESVAAAALSALAREGQLEPAAAAQAIRDLGLDPDAPEPLFA